MNQAEIYLALESKLGRKAPDNCYQAALYLLSQDVDLATVSGKYIHQQGINFEGIKKATQGFDKRTRQVVDIAHNLFSCKSKCAVSPTDISELGYPYMEAVCNAVYIASGGVQVVITPQRELVLDSRQYQQTVRMCQQLTAMAAAPYSPEISV